MVGASSARFDCADFCAVSKVLRVPDKSKPCNYLGEPVVCCVSPCPEHSPKLPTGLTCFPLPDFSHGNFRLIPDAELPVTENATLTGLCL